MFLLGLDYYFYIFCDRLGVKFIFYIRITPSNFCSKTIWLSRKAGRQKDLYKSLGSPLVNT